VLLFTRAQAGRVDAYELVTANDAEGRDPTAWSSSSFIIVCHRRRRRVEGSGDGQAFVLLDEQTGSLFVSHLALSLSSVT
jgi:hypothetical protein